ncbi:istB-like ATP binding family protein, partial [Mycobacterium avium MAV_120809_2495]
MDSGTTEPGGHWPTWYGKSHLLIGCGHAAVHAGFKVRYFTAADLIEVLYRGLADNTVGKIIDTLLRADLVILDEIASPARRHRDSTVVPARAAGYERRLLAIASHWPSNNGAIPARA